MEQQNVTNGNPDVDNANMRGNPAPTLGQIVGFLKYGVSKRINCIRKTPGVKLWQQNYYEHIIRNKNEYSRITKYIENNPIKWESDILNSVIPVDAGSPRTNANKKTLIQTTETVRDRIAIDQMRVLIDNKSVKGIRLTE